MDPVFIGLPLKKREGTPLTYRSSLDQCLNEFLQGGAVKGLRRCSRLAYKSETVAAGPAEKPLLIDVVASFENESDANSRRDVFEAAEVEEFGGNSAFDQVLPLGIDRPYFVLFCPEKKIGIKPDRIGAEFLDGDFVTVLADGIAAPWFSEAIESACDLQFKG